MIPALTLSFPNGLIAQAIVMQAGMQKQSQLIRGLEVIGLQPAQPVLVIVGGASHLSDADYQKLDNLFTQLLAPLAEELGLVVVDGGTDAGVMQLIGRARAKIGGSFPLVGVAPSNKVQLPQVEISDSHALEPHHTHFVLVPGNQWGDESPWIAEVASILAGSAPSMTLLMNGGQISLKDVQESIAEKRPVVVISGTGRLADRIATALQNPQSLSAEALSMYESKQNYFKLFDLAESEAVLKPFLQHYFKQNQKCHSGQPNL
jgi:SLOG in TRPM, prokaryote